MTQVIILKLLTTAQITLMITSEGNFKRNADRLEAMHKKNKITRLCSTCHREKYKKRSRKDGNYRTFSEGATVHQALYWACT